MAVHGRGGTLSAIYCRRHLDIQLSNVAFRVFQLCRQLWSLWGTKVCRYNWHSAGSLGCPFPMLKYKYIFLKQNIRKQFYQTALGKLIWFEIFKMQITVEKNKCVVLFIITFGTLFSKNLGTFWRKPHHINLSGSKDMAC